MQLHAEDHGGVAEPTGGDDAVAELRRELEGERRGLAELRTLFELVLGAVTDAVVLVDEAGRVSWLNRAAARLTDQAPEALAGHTVHSIFATDVPATPRDVVDRSPDGPETLETTSAPSTARSVNLRVSCSVLRDADGKVVGAVYSAHDRSEEQHLVDQLDQAEERWRLLAELGDLLGREVDPYETLPEACRWLARATGTSVAVLLVAGTMIGRVVAWPPDEAIGSQLTALSSQPMEEGSALWIAVRHAHAVHLGDVHPTTDLLGAGGVPAGIRSASLVPMVSRDTCLGALLAHSSHPGGVPERLSGILEEAAGRVALALANGQLRETLSHLKAAQDAAHYREELLATASHDMQTPLAVLLGSVTALQGGGSLSGVQRALLYERMARRGAQLRRLVQQFLDYSRLEAGRPIVVRPSLGDVGAAISSIEAVVAGRCPIVVDMPDGLPPAYVDLDRLEQVLANLASNAVKFSREGTTIKVTARATPDCVEIEVADQGRGMSPEDLGRAFEKFHRGTGAEGTQGTGLGLYMSRALVEAQGGSLSAASALGAGSRFTVRLPRWPVGPAP